jgi:hypothetical protein
MHATPKATAALALLALGWATAVSPALAEEHHGDTDKAAAYQAEGLGTDPGGLTPSTDLVPNKLGPGSDLLPTTADDLRPGGGGVVTQTAPQQADPMGHARLASRMLHGAEAALRQGRFAAAEHALERAETAVLNARSDGDGGYAQSVGDLAQARKAVRHHDRKAADHAMADALRDVANRA